MKKSNAVAVLIPAYNEGSTIGSIVTRVKAVDAGKVYVVDDGSIDSTSKYAEECGAEVIRHPVNLGGGAAIQTGLTLCLHKNVRYVVTLDADGQHDPKEIPGLIGTMMSEKAGLVVGSRFLEDKRLTMSPYRNMGVRFFSLCTSLLTGMKLTDVTSCYRVYDMEIMRDIIPSLRETQYYSIETLLRIAQAGARIVEVEVMDSPRLQGESKKGVLRYMYNLVKQILRLVE